MIQKAFHLPAFLRPAGSAKIGFEFEAIKDRRIMAGGDHDPADRAQVADREGNAGGGRGLGREDDLIIVAGENLGGDAGEAVGKKATIITDHDFRLALEKLGFRISDFGFPKGRRRLGDARDIFKSEILRDDRAPAVCAEFDLAHARKSGRGFALFPPQPQARKRVGLASAKTGSLGIAILLMGILVINFVRSFVIHVTEEYSGWNAS